MTTLSPAHLAAYAALAKQGPDEKKRAVVELLQAGISELRVAALAGLELRTIRRVHAQLVPGLVFEEDALEFPAPPRRKQAPGSAHRYVFIPGPRPEVLPEPHAPQKRYTKWRPEEDALLEYTGLSAAECGRLLGRGVPSVRNRRSTLGIRVAQRGPEERLAHLQTIDPAAASRARQGIASILSTLDAKRQTKDALATESGYAYDYVSAMLTGRAIGTAESWERLVAAADRMPSSARAPIQEDAPRRRRGSQRTSTEA